MSQRCNNYAEQTCGCVHSASALNWPRISPQVLLILVRQLCGPYLAPRMSMRVWCLPQVAPHDLFRLPQDDSAILLFHFLFFVITALLLTPLIHIFKNNCKSDSSAQSHPTASHLTPHKARIIRKAPQALHPLAPPAPLTPLNWTPVTLSLNPLPGRGASLLLPSQGTGTLHFTLPGSSSQISTLLPPSILGTGSGVTSSGRPSLTSI